MIITIIKMAKMILWWNHYNDWQYDDEKAAADDDDSDDYSYGGGGGGLMALKTAVAAWCIEVGVETKVQIPCNALRKGLVGLSKVAAVCLGYNGGFVGGHNSHSGGSGIVTDAAE